MNKKILLLIAIFTTFFYSSAQDQCQNLSIEEVPSTCVIPYTELVANFLDTEYRDTDTYAINGEAACIPDVTGTTDTGIVVDDDWGTFAINIGFTFCFYGNMYDQVLVSDNGKVTFDLDMVGQNDSNWRLNAGDQLPNINWQPNCIFGPFFDSNSNRLPTAERAGAISFKFFNQDQTIPANVGNRVFMISFNSPSFGNGCDVQNSMLRSTILLYETSNVIDVEIRQKNVCTAWNNGRALVGIQNKSATRGMSPNGRGTIVDGVVWDPRRTNITSGDTDDSMPTNQPDGELWRFVPDGDQLDYDFAWFEDTGNGWDFVSGDPTINVTPEATTLYKAELTFQGECTYSPTTILEVISVDPLQNVTGIQVPENLVACETTAGGGTADFDLNQEAILLVDFPASDWSNYSISYHTSLSDSNQLSGGINPITTLNPYNSTSGVTIFVRVEDANDPACYMNRSFTLTVSPLEDSSFSYPNVQYCTGDINPIPTALFPGGTYAINNGGTIDSTTGVIDLLASGLGDDGTGVFAIDYTTAGTCSASSQVTVTIVILNDALFTYPTSICIHDTNPIATPTSTGGIFTVDNGATIDGTTGELDLSSTTEGTTYEITYSFGGNCPSSISKLILVNETPTANTTTVINSCNNGDGTANFDISGLESTIIGSQSNVTLTYHATQDDADNGMNPLNTTPEVRASGDIYARAENMNGCFTTVVIPLFVEECFVVLPNGFSPSSQVVENQTFNTHNIKTRFPNYTLHIYNRFGNEVFEGNASKSDWNGKLNNTGELLPVGTYFYGIKLNDEQDIHFRGWVYLQH